MESNKDEFLGCLKDTLENERMLEAMPEKVLSPMREERGKSR